MDGEALKCKLCDFTVPARSRGYGGRLRDGYAALRAHFGRAHGEEWNAFSAAQREWEEEHAWALRGEPGDGA